MKLAALLLLPLVVMNALAAPPPLPDQHGEPSGLADFTGQAVLAIVVTGRKLRQIERWEQQLRPDFPSLTSIRVADITEEPRPPMQQVADKISARAPDNVSILIDMENQWATEYDLDTDEPCLLLFDADHQVIGRFRGRAKKARVQEVAEQLTIHMPAAKEQLP